MGLLRLPGWLRRRPPLPKEFGCLIEPVANDELISLDCETTGLDPRRAELVSIAAVRLRGRQVFSGEALELHLEAPSSLDGESIRIHRLRRQDLLHQPSAQQALAELLRFIGSRPLLGYHIRFDLALLNRYLMQLWGFRLPNRRLELADEYRRRVRRCQHETALDLRFETLARTLEIPVIGRHSAGGDALTTALMYLRLRYGPPPYQ